MAGVDDYIVHKVDRLWKELEDLKKRVEALERGSAPGPVPEPAQSAAPPVAESQPAGRVEKKVVDSPHVDPVVKILREKGPLNVIQINSELREMGLAETVRDTLFKRLKKLMEEGKVGFDDKTQSFYAR